MVVATAGLTYSFEKLGGGLKAMLAAGTGMYLDLIHRHRRTPGCRWSCTAYGNVRSSGTLGAGETIEVEPGGFLYKDSAVAVETVTHKLAPEKAPSSAVSRAPRASPPAVSPPSRQHCQGLDQGRRGSAACSPASGEVLQTAVGDVLPGPGITLMRLTGPGRVGIQSMYVHHETG